jgi:FlaA1/EpsC-like NDP-sugar epimerase
MLAELKDFCMKKWTTSFTDLYSKMSMTLAKKGVLHAYIPRWIVWLLDMLLVMTAYALTVGALRLTVNYNLIAGFEKRVLVIFAVYALMEFWTGIYRGTVRHSTLSDMVRLFFIVGASTLISMGVFKAMSPYVPAFHISPAVLVVHGAISFFLLFILRIAVRYTYFFLAVNNAPRKRCLVYGIDPDTIMMAELLNAESQSGYHPVGLLDNEHSHSQLVFGSLPVYEMPETDEELISLMEKLDVQILIFRNAQLKELPTAVIDRFLAVKMRLLVMGQTTDLADHNKKARMSVNDIRIEDLLNREVITTDNVVVAEKHHDRVVLITGAAGSIGSEVAMQVARFNPKKLILLDMAETPLYEIELKITRTFPDLDIVIFIGDVRNKDRMRQLFEMYHPEVIYHAAAYKHVPMMERYPCEAVRVNVMGTRIMADLAVEFGSRKFVMISTDKAVNPTNVMGASKRIAEIYVQSLFLSLEGLTKQGKKRTRFITTRFGNVLGSNGSVVPLFKEQIAKGGPVTLTHKDIIRYFMTIPEACRLVLEAGCMGRGGEIFIFDMGEPVKIYNLAKRMIQLSGLTPGRDIEIVETGLRPGEKLYEELLNDAELTLPTYHKKIKVAKVREYDYARINKAVSQLVALAEAGDEVALVRMMKYIVPEYHSQNSRFQAIDEEIAMSPQNSLLESIN